MEIVAIRHHEKNPFPQIAGYIKKAHRIVTLEESDFSDYIIEQITESEGDK